MKLTSLKRNAECELNTPPTVMRRINAIMVIIPNREINKFSTLSIGNIIGKLWSNLQILNSCQKYY